MRFRWSAVLAATCFALISAMAPAYFVACCGLLLIGRRLNRRYAIAS